jgi:diketogulonate reductase-like aldo/keto reductase
VVLNFLMRHPGIFTIPKASRPERVRENSGGVGWKMTKEDFAAIDRAFPVPDQNIPLGII